MLETSIARIAEACLEAPLRESPWGHVVSALARELDGQAVLLSLAPGWSPMGPAFFERIDPDEMRKAVETYHRFNPWAPIRPAGLEGNYFASDLPREVLRTNAFYNEWMVPAGLGSEVVCGGFPVVRDDRSELLLAVMSPTGTHEVQPAHLALGQRVMPYLERTFLLVEKLEASGSAGEAEGSREPRAVHHWSSEVLDRLRVGALVVDAAGRLAYANAAADDILTAGALRCVHGRLATRCELETRRLHELIAVAASNVTALGGALPLRASGEDESLQVLVTPLTGHDSSAGRALCLVVPKDLPRDTTADLLRRSFGLTPAEARLTVRLASDLNLRTAAELEGIAYETARTYFKRAADKLGVRSQTAAVERVRQLGMVRAS